MQQTSARSTLVVVLVVSGIVTTVAGIVMAVAMDALIGAIVAAIGLSDLALAGAFASARLGTPAQVEDAEMRDDLAPGDATQDPSYNPYARED